MKKLYFLLFLAISFLGNAQIVNIPDPIFKAYLLSASPSNYIASIDSPSFQYNAYNEPFATVSSYNSIDVNGDGEIQVSEAQSIKYLKIQYLNTSFIEGISAFSNLEYIYIYLVVK